LVRPRLEAERTCIDLASVNPAEKLEKLGGSADGFYTWPEQDGFIRI